jgi:hypothetical protein
MDHKIEGINYHRHWWKTAEWWVGIGFLSILGFCFFRGLSASDLSAWMALGLNFYIIGRTFYKRGRAIMGTSSGEIHAVTIQGVWNTTALFLNFQSKEETAMWCTLAYGVFCFCRGLAKQRIAN